MHEQLVLWCRQGHLMTDDNTRLGREGEPHCRQCLKIHLAAVRRWMDEKRDGRAQA
jgi:hypothetical protein